MASNQLNQVLKAEELLPPLSPLSESVNNPKLSLTITIVFEFEKPFTKSQTIELLRDVLIPASPRFSCIIFTDPKGVQRWKKVDLVIEDHIIVPPTIPPAGSSLEDSQRHFHEYLSEISREKLSGEKQPPWEAHMITYPTSNATVSLVFRLNHALGDGYSLMTALFSSVKRTDDASLPITFPSSSSPTLMHRRNNCFSRISSLMCRCLNTVSDSISTLLLSTSFMEDDKTAIRSATPGVESEPTTVSSVMFDLDEIRQIKNMVACTVNDVILGLISFTIQLYIQRLEPVSARKRVSALVLMNIRNTKAYQKVESMSKTNEWGNRFGFLSFSIPLFRDSENIGPLDFIIQAKKQMDQKKNSAAASFSAQLMNVLKNIIGSKAVDGLVHSTIKHTSLGVSNIIGPMQKVALADNPVNGFYFIINGVPQSLFFTVMSYMGKLTVVTAAEKWFIDSELLSSCMKEAFANILEAASEK